MATKRYRAVAVIDFDLVETTTGWQVVEDGIAGERFNTFEQAYASIDEIAREASPAMDIVER